MILGFFAEIQLSGTVHSFRFVRIRTRISERSIIRINVPYF